LKNQQKAAQESKNNVASNIKPIIKITIIGDSAVEVLSLPANETKTIEEPKTINQPAVKGNSEESADLAVAVPTETANPDENKATSEEPNKAVDAANPPGEAVEMPSENVDEEYAAEWEVDATVKLILDYISLLTVICKSKLISKNMKIYY